MVSAIFILCPSWIWAAKHSSQIHIGKLHRKVLTFHRSVSPHRKPIWLGWDTVYPFQPIQAKTAEPDLYFRLGYHVRLVHQEDTLQYTYSYPNRYNSSIKTRYFMAERRNTWISIKVGQCPSRANFKLQANIHCTCFSCLDEWYSVSVTTVRTKAWQIPILGTSGPYKKPTSESGHF